MAKEKLLSIEETRNVLKLPADVFNAVAQSGLLGYSIDGKFSWTAVEHFQLYGTQWRHDLGKRGLTYDTYRGLADISAKRAGGAEPPGTYTQIQIAPRGTLAQADHDHGWLAQFYLKVNEFYFPASNSVTPVGIDLLRVDRFKKIVGASLPTIVFPDPTGDLAMFTVLGNPTPPGEPFEVALDIILPILDELTSRFDCPLFIVQSMVIGIPSGTITVDVPYPTPQASLNYEDEILPRTPYPELATALALYREGMTSNNPFHQFLSFWKAYENACQVRGIWCNRNRQRCPQQTPERFPDVWAFRGARGQTFDEVRQRLNDPYRNALAHGGLYKGTKPRASISSAAYSEVWRNCVLVQFMAKVTIHNLRCAFEQVNAP